MNENDHHKPWHPEMPFISFPTETVRTHEVRPDEQPPSMTMASDLGTSNFPMGMDTCGFTTASTITCDYGYQCTDVGNHRGCCVAGADDCIATIYTDCIDNSRAPDIADCGLHTLCCPDTKPYCFTYAFSTTEDPGVTFTYVECNPSQGFGELFPFPPELTMTTDTSTTDSSSSSDSPNPSSPAAEKPSSHSSRSTGAIVGGVIGGVAFIILAIAVAVLLIRYRRQRHHAALKAAIIPMGPAKSSADTSASTEKDQAVTVTTDRGTPTRRTRLRPLSTVREQPSPGPGSPTRRSTPAARRSFGPNWPLGPASNPLGAHPVDANLKKRLSDSRLGARGPALAGEAPRVPSLRLPPPGSRPAPLTTPRSGAGLQSPRLDYVPVSPIEGVAFGDGGGRSIDGLGFHGDSAAAAATTHDGNVEPVSPIDSDGGEDEEADLQRLSYVSAPSAHLERDGIVSPVGPHVVVERVEEEEERAGSPVTVSPLESRRGSVDS
ncbi:hypothetical protein F4804DRAFT_4296 [Jackrogersella minutella]|nr:hypothetical protein F4804DRAFT_4296 [Jackrogersella minutella]